MTKEEFLVKLFEKSGIDTNFRFGRDEIVEEFGIEKDTFDKFANYWVDKGLLHGPNQTTVGGHLTLFFNSSGIDHVEDLIKEENQTHQKKSMQEDSIKIFVSHKSSDIELTKALVKLLTASLKINNEDIRCTSVPGFRLDAGIDTNDAIRKEVNESALLICLLTPESLKSSFVLFELGARWGVMKPLIPLLAHGADYSDLPSPIRDKNAVKLEKEEDLHDLIDSISKHIDVSKNKITSYQDEFNTVIKHAVKKKVDEIREKSTQKSLDVQEVIKTDVTKILSQREIDGILRSTEGVIIAKEAGEKFYSELEKICTENSYPKSGVVFNIKRKQTTELCWEADLYGNGGTARVELYIPATNRVRTGVKQADDAHIRIFAANYNLFDSYHRFAESNKRTYEKHYYLTLNESKEPNWSEEKRADRGISTEALLSNIFLEFYEFTKRYWEQL